MKREYLFDLDELVLKCHSSVAREAITEAITCYRAGAFRSCIVSTWNAVVWDYLDKLRFLEANGDNQAKAVIEKWEKNYNGQTRQDITDLLQFEREVVTRLATYNAKKYSSDCKAPTFQPEEHNARYHTHPFLSVRRPAPRFGLHR